MIRNGGSSFPELPAHQLGRLPAAKRWQGVLDVDAVSLPEGVQPDQLDARQIRGWVCARLEGERGIQI